jgi:hypothetical protein
MAPEPMQATLSLLLGAAVLAGAGVRADEQTIRQVLAPKLGDGKIVEVRKLGQAGLYDVSVRRPDGFAVIYTDETASVIFVGSLIDARTGTSRVLRAVAGAPSSTRGSGPRPVSGKELP